MIDIPLPWTIDSFPSIMVNGNRLGTRREYMCDGCGCLWWGPMEHKPFENIPAGRPDCPVCEAPSPFATDTFGFAYTLDNSEYRKAFYKKFGRTLSLAVAELTPDYSHGAYLYRVPFIVCRLQWEALGKPGRMTYDEIHRKDDDGTKA